ncbi:MAG: hypothetical protein JWP35_3382 [Caulobacter sp.]|nr:hypothetical protein [Caulobacter sp.]
MTTELAMAAVIAALGLFQVAWGAFEYRRVHGLVYANTARDKPPAEKDSPLLGRVLRAQANLMETAPYFIAICIVLTLAHTGTEVTRIAALVFVAARLIYLPLYAAGVPNLRGLVWTISFIALVVMAWVAVAAIPWASVLHPH